MYLMKAAQETKTAVVPTTAPMIEAISTVFLSVVSFILYEKKTHESFTFIKKVDLIMICN